MRNSGIKRILVTLSCLLIFGGMLLFLAACGGGSTPGSPGPQSTPPGYNLIGVFSHEIQTWWQHK